MAICRPWFIVLVLVTGASKSETSSLTIHGESDDVSLLQQNVQVVGEAAHTAAPAEQVKQPTSTAQKSGTTNNSIAEEGQAADDITSFLQERLSVATVKAAIGTAASMLPKSLWEEPLTPEQEAEFQRDMDMPIKQWIQENPELNSDYFVKFGMTRGYPELKFWIGVHDITNYFVAGVQEANWWWGSGPFHGYGKGLPVTMDVDGSNFSTTLDHRSFLPEDPYCFTFEWHKGQGLDGSLMWNSTAWEELAKRECDKIQAIEQFPDELHTVRHHVEFNRIWPGHCQCNVIDGIPPGGLPKEYWFDMSFDSTNCTPTSKRDFREHVYRKCLLGFAASEMSFCYQRGCLLEGNRLGHGPECV
mmetsp:Transcript_110547/g.191181  ORF Transcript_110547/g.191181 Transcript_110547/m.191181 type:complete len:359 (+) Transcript_110547:58-1134(+)